MDSLLSIDMSLEEMAQQIAKIYKNVNVNKNPMFQWINILNDATILAEEIRRGNQNLGTIRAGKILMRLLEFIGYYRYVYIKSDKNDLADILFDVFNEKSYETYYGDKELEEGPTRWIYAKYPSCLCKVWPEKLQLRTYSMDF